MSSHLAAANLNGTWVAACDGGATNPEQLFAAGYAACFENAAIHVTRRQTDKVGDDAVEVVAEVGLADNGQGGFALEVALNVAITGFDQAKAEEIVQAAHLVCPYFQDVAPGHADREEHRLA